MGREAKSNTPSEECKISIFFSKKVVDLEVKSDQIQNVLTKIMSNLIDINQSLTIVTPSLCVKYYKVYPIDNSPKEYSNQNRSSIKLLDLLSILTKNNPIYANEIILIKVSFLFFNKKMYQKTPFYSTQDLSYRYLCKSAGKNLKNLFIEK